MFHVTNLQISTHSCVTNSTTAHSALLAAVLWLPVFVFDVVKDVSLAVHQHGLSCHTYNRHTHAQPAGVNNRENYL